MTLRDKCVDALFREFKLTGASSAGEAQRQAVDIIFAEIANPDDETMVSLIKADLDCRENLGGTDQE